MTFVVLMIVFIVLNMFMFLYARNVYMKKAQKAAKSGFLYKRSGRSFQK